MNERLKVGVVGVGFLGKHHARIWSMLDNAALVGVSDINTEQGQKIASEFGVEFFHDFRELIGKVDCVSVAVSTSAHWEVCSPFLDAGCHVLVEKPISATLEEARDLVKRASENNVILQVGHLERFNPALLAVKPLINNPKFFEVHRLGIFVPRSIDVDVVLDLMIHDIDLVRSMVRSSVTDIKAVGIPILTDKIDIANARLEFENGIVANLTSSRVSSEKVRKLRFFQPNDYISLDLGRQDVSVYSLKTADTPFGKEIISRNIIVQREEPLRLEIESFANSVLSMQPPECSGEDGLAALEIANEIIKVMHTV